jgi:hypothetical protein
MNWLTNDGELAAKLIEADDHYDKRRRQISALGLQLVHKIDAIRDAKKAHAAAVLAVLESHQKEHA